MGKAVGNMRMLCDLGPLYSETPKSEIPKITGTFHVCRTRRTLHVYHVYNPAIIFSVAQLYIILLLEPSSR